MPAPIHAIVVVRAEARSDSVAHLTQTLAALDEQTYPVDALTIVQCGTHKDLTEVLASSGAESVITASAGTTYAAAIKLASRRIAKGHSLWLLAQDTIADPDALQHLAAKLETAPSVAVVAPKLVRANDPTILQSVGVTMTQLGRTVTLGTGQIDQGQHDDVQDILGSDIRGVLIRAEEVSHLLPDVALAGADEGLDIGVRARVRERRVDLVPAAIVAVYGDGVAGLPAPRKQRDRRRIGFVTRVAQLHRRLAYAPVWAVALHILSFPFIALWRTIQHFLDKQPARVLPEWGATVLVAVRWGAIARSRRALGGSHAGFRRIDALRLTRRQVKVAERASTAEDMATLKSDLRFFSGGGAWVTLAAFVLSIVIFPVLLTWPSLAGGALLPLRETVAQLWADTRYGYAGIGLDGIGPADPFSVLVALFGSVTPAAPGIAFVALWVLALPLAVVGGWFATTRITERAGLRIAGALLWAFAPTFLSALITPRPTAVIVHLLLPWLCYAAMIAHRSWGAAGAASLILAAVTACSPTVGLLLIALCVVAFVVFLAWGRVRAAVRYLWVIVPTLVWFAPIAWHNFVHGTPLATLVDPGPVFAGARAEESWLGRLLTAVGFADADPGGWASFLQTWDLAAFAPLIAIVVVPLVVSAFIAPFLNRWRVGTALVVAGVVATIAALLVARFALSYSQGQPVAVWPGALLSAAWLAFVLAAIVVWDGAQVPRRLLSAVAAVGTILIVASAVPMLTAPARGEALLVQGPSTTLPAFVAAEARDDRTVGTLVLLPHDDGSFTARVVWGGTDSLGSQSTLVSSRVETTENDERIASEVAAIVTPGAGTSAEAIAELGVRYVLVDVTEEGARAQAVREAAIASLDLRSGLTRVGETGKGALWRLDTDPAERPSLTREQQNYANIIMISGALISLIALLLAIPTPTSVRASRQKPRIVDARGAEEI